MSDETVQHIADLSDIKEALQRSSVKIEMNSKGLAQTKISVCAGESDEEMRRLAELALRTFTDLQESLGRLARFV